MDTSRRGGVLRLRDVPGAWLQDPVAIGYVFLRVVKRGKKTVATPVAKLLLQMLDSKPDGEVPPGTPVTPEPCTLALLGLGALPLAARLRRRQA